MDSKSIVVLVVFLASFLTGGCVGWGLVPYFHYVFKNDEELIKFAEKLVKFKKEGDYFNT